MCGWRMASGRGLGEGRVMIVTTPKLGSRGNNVQPTDRCGSCMCWKDICEQWKYSVLLGLYETLLHLACFSMV